eukprot:TRINITY_DN121320_c0_g1_i1.p1 TRINITY_DN121320_c0_g1~~TRINITY_DN121320_c0_g1_i1.p1  ORF type:complete len:291 (-),score=52.55 TRINITY_DN121320_c0_g1_i1:246-1118(-)
MVAPKFIEDEELAAFADCTQVARSVENRPRLANYNTDVSYEVETQDNEDHTFNGIMFNVRGKADLPVLDLRISEVAVRGELGPMTVWWTDGPFQKVKSSASAWTKVYERRHSASWSFTTLILDAPIVVLPGKVTGIYIHSAGSQEALVYDERRSYIPYEDSFVKILHGAAHLDSQPFGDFNPWFGGRGAFRANRNFVGRLAMSARYMLWNPESHRLFPKEFRDMVLTLLLCARRPESPLSRLSDWILFWILNMCRWDWPMKSGEDLPQVPAKKRRRRNGARPLAVFQDRG